MAMEDALALHKELLQSLTDLYTLADNKRDHQVGHITRSPSCYFFLSGLRAAGDGI